MLQSQALNMISDNVKSCNKCQELSEFRIENTYFHVPGTGMPNAEIMIIGEAPGKDEAEQGLPFVGRAGDQLTKIIEAVGWKREEIFIANMCKCRPPNNRVPTKEELANCRNFLDLQIKCVNPSWIICLGKTASLNFLNIKEDMSMKQLRGTSDYQGRKVICTYHPSFLLRGNDWAKKEVWNDLQPRF